MWMWSINFIVQASRRWFKACSVLWRMIFDMDIASEWNCTLTTLCLTHLPMTILLMKMLEFRFGYHWNLSLRVQLAINQHCFSYWLVACSVPSHYLNQCCPSSMTHICGTRGRWVNFRITTACAASLPRLVTSWRRQMETYSALSKQPLGWWFETPSCSLWRQCNDHDTYSQNANQVWDLYV